MNEFVEECRREWKRLGVLDAVANEMAADLEADLADAAADGASPEDVLGTGAFDPKSFAASWAAARGVIGPARVIRRGTRVPLALVGFAALAIVGLVLVVAPPSRTVRVAVPSTLPRIAFMPAPRLRQVRPGLPRVWFPLRRAEVVAVAPGGRRPLWWVGLGALVVGGAGVVWSALALRS